LRTIKLFSRFRLQPQLYKPADRDRLSIHLSLINRKDDQSRFGNRWRVMLKLDRETAFGFPNKSGARDRDVGQIGIDLGMIFNATKRE
jgi:hypothetical protein